MFTRKLNKKGKPVGKAVLTDFVFKFSTPLNQTTAAIAANYQLDSISIKKVKKKTTTILHPITEFTVSYIQATDSVDLKLIGTQAFPTGGRLTVLERLAGTGRRRLGHAARGHDRVCHLEEGNDDQPVGRRPYSRHSSELWRPGGSLVHAYRKFTKSLASAARSDDA